MKRSGPIQRRTPLPRRPPTRRGNASTKRKANQVDPKVWAQRREELYARAGGRCERCGTSLDHSGMHGHHRQRRREGDHRLVNLAALCPRDHQWVHEHPTEARQLGFIVLSSEDPAAAPVQLHTGAAVLLTLEGGYADAA